MILYLTVFQEVKFDPDISGIITNCMFKSLLVSGYDCSIHSLPRWVLP